MKTNTICIIGLALLLSYCGQPNNNQQKSFEKNIFDIEHFKTLTDPLLTSIAKKKIKLNYSVDSTTTALYTKKRYNFDPGKGKNILRLWIEIYTYNDQKELDKDFERLQKEGWDNGNADETPGLTKTNDHVFKTDMHIVWLNTGCAYAYANHQNLKNNLLNTLNTNTITDSIVCRCGGTCKK